MADSPKEAEAAQALFCAIADYLGKSKTNKELNLKKHKTYLSFKKANKKAIDEAIKKIDLPSINIKQIEEYLKKDNGWYESSILIAVKIINDIASIDPDFAKLTKPGWQNIFYVRGAKADKSRAANSMENIEALFKIANTNDSQFGDVNKWSPADIYFVSVKADKTIDEEIKSLSKKAKKGNGKISDSYDFKDLNELVNNLLDSGDLLPLSLKKALGTASLYNYNFDRNQEEKNLAKIKYYGVSDWSKRYTKKKPITRDLQIYFSSNKKEKLKFRHDPHSDNFWTNKSIKCEIEVTGAGGRGGSVVGIPRISQIISLVDKKLGSELSKTFNTGFKKYENGIIKLNKKYGVKKGSSKSSIDKEDYIKYKEERAHLSGETICNSIMPVLYDWFSANEGDKSLEKLNSKIAQKLVAYTSSRSVKSGKFVIAK